MNIPKLTRYNYNVKYTYTDQTQLQREIYLNWPDRITMWNIPKLTRHNYNQQLGDVYVCVCVCASAIHIYCLLILLCWVGKCRCQTSIATSLILEYNGQSVATSVDARVLTEPKTDQLQSQPIAGWGMCVCEYNLYFLFISLHCRGKCWSQTSIVTSLALWFKCKVLLLMLTQKY